ncbi:exocyst complex component exo84 [Mortierella sp. AM989]|nr:exocyst complex component exo84 [Mortierella sp. AM989]
MQPQPRRPHPPPQQRMPPGSGPPPPQGQYMRQQQGPPRPMGGPGGMYGQGMGGPMGPPMGQGGNYPPPNRPRPPPMMPMGNQMPMNGPPRQMGGPMPMGQRPMGGPNMPPMGRGPPPNMGGPMGGPNMGGQMGGHNMGPPYMKGPPPNMGPPRSNPNIPGYRAQPPPGAGPGPGPGSNSMGSIGSGQGAPLSIYGGIGSPSSTQSPTPSTTYQSGPSALAPINYQPKTSHSSTPPSRPAQASTSSPISNSGPTLTSSPLPPLRRENSSPKVRKELPTAPGRESTPSPQIRTEAPIPSPAVRKDAPPVPTAPKPPARRDTSSSLKSQEASSPILKKEVPIPARKDTPPQPVQPIRKNLVSTSSPSPTTPRMLDSSDRRPVVEIGQFAKGDFNYEEYLTQNLANASEETIRSFLQSLKDSKSLAAEDLQENVFKNYNEFVTISKEISKLESDMQTLRGLLDDLKTASDNLVDDDDEFLLTAGIEDSAPVVPKRMTMMVSSMSDLTSVWKAQMVALWEGIEGAQKMLPYHPKRHLIRESPSFVEVNTTTNKIKHPVHIVLMNDTLLVATRKKKTAANSKYKLLGDRCWPLTELTVEDMKDTIDVRNAIKITHGNDYFVYKTEKGQEKQTMLVNLKRTTDEMLARSNESRNRGGLHGFTPAMPHRAGMKFRAPATASQPDARWLAEFTDELDVMIAQRELDNAVAGIEKATVMLSQMTLTAAKLEETRKRLDERVSRLSRVIILDLGQSHITKAAVQRDVGWLERLGCLDQARDVFLANRTKVVRERISQVKPKKDPILHIEELAMIVFTSIKNTSEWFELSFKDPKMSSAVVKWAKQEVEHFAEIHKSIVFGHELNNFQVIADCARIATDQCNKLRDVGLDLAFVLDASFMPFLIETIAEHERRCLERMDAIIEHDDFASMSGDELGSTTPLSASMIAFYTVMLQFVNNICLIGNLTLYSRIVDSVAILFKAYVNRTIQVYEEKGMTDDQRTVHRFNRAIPELEAVREELGGVEL